MNEPNRARTTRHRWVVTLALLFGLFILWPLSEGPVGWMYNHGMLGDSMAMRWVITIVYGPWWWVYDNSEAARAFADWYANLWDGIP